MQDLIIFLGKLAIALFIVRFHTNLYRLGFNPVAAKLNRATDPLVLPFRKLLPASRFDFGAVIVAAIIALFVAFILIPAPLALPIALLMLTSVWLNTVFYAILITVIGSWLQTDPRQPVMQIALSCSDWLMAPLRRIIPPVGMLDFTPMAALFLIYFAQRGIATLIPPPNGNKATSSSPSKSPRAPAATNARASMTSATKSPSPRRPKTAKPTNTSPPGLPKPSPSPKKTWRSKAAPSAR